MVIPHSPVQPTTVCVDFANGTYASEKVVLKPPTIIASEAPALLIWYKVKPPAPLCSIKLHNHKTRECATSLNEAEAEASVLNSYNAVCLKFKASASAHTKKPGLFIYFSEEYFDAVETQDADLLPLFRFVV